MTFLEKLPTTLAAQANKRADKWVDQGIASLHTSVIPKLPAATSGVAYAVADVLTADKDTLHEIAHGGFTTIASHLAMGNEDEAYLVFLAETASYDQRQDALLGAMRSAVNAKAARDELWAKIKKIALEVLQVAGKAAIPLLLSMV